MWWFYAVLTFSFQQHCWAVCGASGFVDFLQMSLDTKRAEIRKLEERARQREEALKKSEVSSGSSHHSYVTDNWQLTP
jgi:hypothetical protein